MAARPTTSVWVAEATEKIPADAAARPESISARISAARNEFEAFQIVVTGSARGVSATATSLAGPGGATISDSNVRLYRAAQMNVTQTSSPDSLKGQIPDALVPDVDEIVNERRNAFPFDVRSESRVIWVEVFVPKTAVPGVYTGWVTLNQARGQLAQIPVELTVWNFELPSTSSLRSAFGLSYNGIPQQHGVSGTEFSALRARYGQLGLDHRVSLSYHDDGWTWTEPLLGGFDTFYGPLIDGTAGTRLEGAQLTAIQYVSNAANLASTERLGQWAAHFHQRDSLRTAAGLRPWWFDHLFQYTCDEPGNQGCGWPDIFLRADAAKAADPSFRTLVTTTIAEADNNLSPDGRRGSSFIDLLVPVINYMDDKPGYPYPGNQRAVPSVNGQTYDTYGDFLNGADPLNELWLYQSCMSHSCGGSDAYGTGWPSYMIDAWGVRNRAMEWLSFRYGATGELYWDTVYAYSTGDPWTSQFQFGGQGDGTVFYPGTPAKIGGTQHIPVASIRLKMIREGMEDYEYLKLVSDLGDPGFAKGVADSLFPTAYSTGARYPSDTQALRTAGLMAARVQLAQRILELQAPAPAAP
jgi:hypothetical protein